MQNKFKKTKHSKSNENCFRFSVKLLQRRKYSSSISFAIYQCQTFIACGQNRQFWMRITNWHSAVVRTVYFWGCLFHSLAHLALVLPFSRSRSLPHSHSHSLALYLVVLVWGLYVFNTLRTTTKRTNNNNNRKMNELDA